MKRIKLVQESPNDLFMQWLTEFRDEARTKGNSGLIKIYNMCIDNLSRYILIQGVQLFLLIPSYKVPSPS